MASSKEMKPISAPFFPNIFFKNQFQSRPVWPKEDSSLAGKNAIVTGANQGLGFEASRQLLSLGLSRLILAVRSVAKGEIAAEKLRKQFPLARIDVFCLDMLSYDSIQAFVDELRKQRRVDIAILNAGVRKMQFETVPSTQHEETIQVNYISTVLLCILLLPILKSGSEHGPGRISIVSSGLALQAKFPNRTASPLLPSFDDASTFDALDRYNTSKLLGMIFLYRLVDYVSSDDVVVNIVDPGFVQGTDLGREVPLIGSLFMGIWKKVAARSLKTGASTYIDAVVNQGKECHGCYLMSWKISP